MSHQQGQNYSANGTFGFSVLATPATYNYYEVVYVNYPSSPTSGITVTYTWTA